MDSEDSINLYEECGIYRVNTSTESTENSSDYCSACTYGGHEPTHLCIDCEVVLCEKLLEFHAKSKTNKQHRVFPLNVCKSNPELQRKNFYCSEHMSEKYTLYDVRTQKPVCDKCVTYNCISLEEAAALRKMQMQLAITSARSMNIKRTRQLTRLNQTRSQLRELSTLIDQTLIDLGECEKELASVKEKSEREIELTESLMSTSSIHYLLQVNPNQINLVFDDQMVTKKTLCQDFKGIAAFSDEIKRQYLNEDIGKIDFD